jgi:hypothetical protein
MSHVAQVARHWLLIAKTLVQFWMTSSEIHGAQSGTRAGFSPNSSVSPADHHSTIASYTCHHPRRCAIDRPDQELH